MEAEIMLICSHHTYFKTWEKLEKYVCFKSQLISNNIYKKRMIRVFFIYIFFLKKSSACPVGSIAYIIDEEALLVRVNKGWQYIAVNQ